MASLLPTRLRSHPLMLANKTLLVVTSIVGLWLAGTRVWTQPGFLLAAYVAISAVTVTAPGRRLAWLWRSVGYLLDLGLVLYLIYASGGLNSPFWPLMALQALFPALYLPWSYLIWFGAFATGPLYVAVLWLHVGSLSFLPDPLFLIRYGVLFLAAILSALAAENLQQGRQQQLDLQQTLATREADLAAGAERLQRTAADLGNRVLQLRALQEVARGLASTLDLEETLQMLADRLAALSGAHFAAIALLENDGAHLRGVAASGETATAILEFEFDLTARPQDAALLHAGQIVTGESSHELGIDRLRQMTGMERFMCLPLVLRGRALGALYLADAVAGPSDSAHDGGLDTLSHDPQRQLLDSFAYFAAAAVENARLYQAVADKSHELEIILAGIGDGVLVVDADLRLLLINPVAAHIFDLNPPPPAGLPVHLLIDNHQFLELLTYVQTLGHESVMDAPTQMRELEVARPGQQHLLTYQALAAPLLLGSSLQGIATVLRDVTSQKELERMKSNFLSVVSHELKTPLHSIKGFVDIILMGKTGAVSEIQRDFLETVKQQTEHLQRMIDDLLEFSRLESGRVSMRLQPVDMPVVIEAVLDKLTPLAESAEVTLINHTPEDLSTISADPWRVEQVVTNLVDNAIKFTPAGGSVLVLAYDAGDCLEVRVEDSGIGIAAGELERIFERFYQVDGGANRLYKGTGLGLTICRHIVEHHGGRIWAESEYGRGASFVFTLSKHLQPAAMAALDFTTLPDER